jgi:hypothetical protein
MKPNAWSQIKNITAEKLIATLEKDSWEKRPLGLSYCKI